MCRRTPQTHRPLDAVRTSGGTPDRPCGRTGSALVIVLCVAGLLAVLAFAFDASRRRIHHLVNKAYLGEVALGACQSALDDALGGLRVPVTTTFPDDPGIYLASLKAGQVLRFVHRPERVGVSPDVELGPVRLIVEVLEEHGQGEPTERRPEPTVGQFKRLAAALREYNRNPGRCHSRMEYAFSPALRTEKTGLVAGAVEAAARNVLDTARRRLEVRRTFRMSVLETLIRVKETGLAQRSDRRPDGTMGPWRRVDLSGPDDAPLGPRPTADPGSSGAADRPAPVPPLVHVSPFDIARLVDRDA